MGMTEQGMPTSHSMGMTTQGRLEEDSDSGSSIMAGGMPTSHFNAPHSLREDREWEEDDDDEDEDSKIGVRSSGKKVHEIPPKQKVHKIPPENVKSYTFEAPTADADENKESEGGVLDTITSYMPSMPENPLKGFFGEEEELLKDDAASLEEEAAPAEDGDSWF